MMLRCNPFTAIAYLLLAAPLPAHAQQPRQPVIEPVLIAPSELQTVEFAASFFTDDTLLVVDVDVSAIDAAAALGWLLPRMGRLPATEQQQGTMKLMAEGMIRTLRDAGVQHVYITVAARDLTSGGASLLVPCDKTATVGNLLEMLLPQLPEAAEYQVKSQPGYVVLSPKSTWERIKGRPAADRQALLDAIRSVEQLPHRIAVQLPEPLRSEVAAIWPGALPKASPVQLSPSQMMADVRAIAIGFRLPPDPQIEVRMMAENESAVGRINDQLQAALKVIPAAIGQPEQEVTDNAVVFRFSGEWFEGAVAQLIQPMQQVGSRQVASNHLKQIGLAMHNYHDTYQTFPPRATITADGKPLLSWRVHLLPFLDQQALYERFRLNEPWDSEHNRALIEELPESFQIPGDRLPAGQTRIRLPQVEGSLWAGSGPPRKFSDVKDGTSNTVAAAVAPPEAAVVWTKPEPWELDEDDLIRSFFGDGESTLGLWLDGSVRALSSATDPKMLRALLTHAGGEVIDYENLP